MANRETLSCHVRQAMPRKNKAPSLPFGLRVTRHKGARENDPEEAADEEAEEAAAEAADDEDELREDCSESCRSESGVSGSRDSDAEKGPECDADDPPPPPAPRFPPHPPPPAVPPVSLGLCICW